MQFEEVLKFHNQYAEDYEKAVKRFKEDEEELKALKEKINSSEPSSQVIMENKIIVLLENLNETIALLKTLALNLDETFNELESLSEELGYHLVYKDKTSKIGYIRIYEGGQ